MNLSGAVAITLSARKKLACYQIVTIPWRAVLVFLRAFFEGA